MTAEIARSTAPQLPVADLFEGRDLELIPDLN
jgi:hypothetical protein